MKGVSALLVGLLNLGAASYYLYTVGGVALLAGIFLLLLALANVGVYLHANKR